LWVKALIFKVAICAGGLMVIWIILSALKSWVIRHRSEIPTFPLIIPLLGVALMNGGQIFIFDKSPPAKELIPARQNNDGQALHSATKTA
jgi:hypothetical protein